MLTKHRTYRSSAGQMWSITITKRANGWMDAKAIRVDGGGPRLHVSTDGNVNDAMKEIYLCIEESGANHAS